MFTYLVNKADTDSSLKRDFHAFSSRSAVTTLFTIITGHSFYNKNCAAKAYFLMLLCPRCLCSCVHPASLTTVLTIQIPPMAMYTYLHHKQLLLTSQVRPMSRVEENHVGKKYLHTPPFVTSKSPLTIFEFDGEVSKTGRF